MVINILDYLSSNIRSLLFLPEHGVTGSITRTPIFMIAMFCSLMDFFVRICHREDIVSGTSLHKGINIHDK